MLVAQQREGIACATTPQSRAEMEQSKAENFLWLGVQGCSQRSVFERYTDFFSFNFWLTLYLIHLLSFQQWIPLHTTSWLCDELVLKAEDGEEFWLCSCTLLFFLPPTVLFIPTDRNFNIHLWQHYFHGLYAYQCQLSFSKENHLLPGETICNFIVRVASLK